MMRNKNTIALMLVMLMVLTSVAVYADNIVPFASTRYKNKAATLSSGLKLTASATTFDDCKELGVKIYVLYESDGTRVKAWFPKAYTAGHKCSFSADLSSYGVRGKSYYVTVTFNAEGEMKTTTTGTVKY